MSALLAQAQQMQQELMAAQQRLIDAEVHGKAGWRPGGGHHQGRRRGRGGEDRSKVVDPDDVETLQDLIIGALADASKQVTALAQQQLGPAGRRHGRALGIPGS